MAEMNSTAPAVFLNELREQTRPQHEALEQIPESKILTSESLDDSSYARYLSRLYPIVKAFEEDIFPIISKEIADLDDRRKEPVLRRDLSEMGVDADALPAFSFDLESSTLPELMGMMYVMEGSTLGGKFIAGNVRKALDRGPENGAGYFSVYGDSLGTKWKKFLDIFVNFVVTSNGETAAIKGARSMFDEMKYWLQKN